MAEVVTEEDKKRLAAEALLAAAQSLPFGGEKFAVKEEELDISNVPASERPIGSGVGDKRNKFAVNELDLPTYTTAFGQDYTVARAEDQRSGREKLTDTIEAIPPISEWRAPTKEELAAFGVAAAEGVYDVIDTPARAVRGEQVNYGDVLDVASSMPLGGLVAAGGDLHYDPDTLRMFIGPKAKNANLDDLEQAKRWEEQGATPKEIFQQTMWIRGPDKKWRQEVSDQSFELNPSLAEDVQMGATVGTSINGKAYEGYNLTKKPSSYERNYDEEIKVGLDRPIPNSGLKGTHQGAYGDKKETITTYSNDPKEIESTLLHELQHAIQSKEGFSSGSSSGRTTKLKEDFLNQLPSSHKKYVYDQTALSRIMDDMLDLDAEVQAAKSGAKGWGSTGGDGSELTTVEKEYDDLARLYGNKQQQVEAFEEKYPDSVKALEPINMFLQSDAHKNYLLNAGEVEARVTQDRHKMTLDERRANPPDLTLNAFPGVWTEDSLFLNMRRAVEAALKEEGRSADDAYAHMLNTPVTSSSSEVVALGGKASPGKTTFSVFHEIPDGDDINTDRATTHYKEPKATQGELYREDISFDNPLVVDSKASAARLLGVKPNRLREALREKGHDGLVIQDKKGEVKDFVSLSEEQNDWLGNRKTVRVVKDPEHLSKANFGPEDMNALRTLERDDPYVRMRLENLDGKGGPEEIDARNILISELEGLFPEFKDEIRVNPLGFWDVIEAKAGDSLPLIEPNFKPSRNKND